MAAAISAGDNVYARCDAGAVASAPGRAEAAERVLEHDVQRGGCRDVQGRRGDARWPRRM